MAGHQPAGDSTPDPTTKSPSKEQWTAYHPVLTKYRPVLVKARSPSKEQWTAYHPVLTKYRPVLVKASIAHHYRCPWTRAAMAACRSSLRFGVSERSRTQNSL